MRTVLLCIAAFTLGMLFMALLVGLGDTAKAANPSPEPDGATCRACGGRGYQVMPHELTPRACWCTAGTEWHRLHPHVIRLAPPP